MYTDTAALVRVVLVLFLFCFWCVKVWDDRGPGHLRFDDESGAGASLGFISEHGVIHSALFERVRELEAAGLAELTCPAQVTNGATCAITQFGVQNLIFFSGYGNSL